MASGRILQNARVGRADKLWPTSYVYIKRGDDKGCINISTEGKTVYEDQPQSWKSLGSVVTKEVEIVPSGSLVGINKKIKKKCTHSSTAQYYYTISWECNIYRYCVQILLHMDHMD